MMKRWQWAMQLLTRRMWFRAGVFCLFAVLLALAGALLGRLISYDLAAKIGAKSVDNILNVLATSMLAVTTFSLTAMVSAYSGATSNITPRAVQLLIEDPTAQNALSTFLGSFLFATVGIIALSTGVYGETGRVILYAGTVLVIAVIVVTFLRWIEHLTRFGRVSDTIARVERAALKATSLSVAPIIFGPVRSSIRPPDATVVAHDRIGRVTHIDYASLGEIAKLVDAEIHLLAFPGAMVEPSRPIAWTTARLDDEARTAIAASFTVERNRAFDHDPRFGLVVLSEIASRALSPAVNDPGTAIAVLEAGTRVLDAMLSHRIDDDHRPPPGVVAPAFRFSDVLEDLFRPIARDGAAMVEVDIRLQKALVSLKTSCPEALQACEAAAADALSRAVAALDHDSDRTRLEQVYRRHWPMAESA